MSFRVDTKLLQYIPKFKQVAVKAIWKDSDGYWVGLQDPWYATSSEIPSSWIHTESIAELKREFRDVVVIEDP